MTLVPGLAARDVLRAVRGRRRCFVKDSFLDLGLSRLERALGRAVGAGRCAYGPDGLAGGGIANRTGSVVGVSNVFTTTMAVPDAWAGIVHALATLFPSLPQVGYERGESLESALAAGFSEIGPLWVWLRPAPTNG